MNKKRERERRGRGKEIYGGKNGFSSKFRVQIACASNTVVCDVERPIIPYKIGRLVKKSVSIGTTHPSLRRRARKREARHAHIAHFCRPCVAHGPARNAAESSLGWSSCRCCCSRLPSRRAKLRRPSARSSLMNSR